MGYGYEYELVFVPADFYVINETKSHLYVLINGAITGKGDLQEESNLPARMLHLKLLSM
jgi:hypothetical protein